MSVKDHSRIQPSAFHLTVPCPGSLQLQERVPEQPDTEELAEGKAAHVVAAWAAAGTLPDVGYAFEYGGRTWTVDEDMRDGAILYAEACQVGSDAHIEQPVQIPRIHADCWGTPDFWRFFPAESPQRLRVVDYKYGHRYVDPFENLQIGAGYASGVLSSINVSPGDDEMIVEIVIVQPRAFHKDGPVKTWTTTPFQLNSLVQKTREAVELALSDTPPTNTGAHCLDCTARAICSTLRASAAHVVDFSGSLEPQELDVTAAAVELRIVDEAAKRLDARRTGLAAQVEVELRNGNHVPLWKLEAGRSRWEWNADVTVDEVSSLGDLIGINVKKPAALMTPTQVKKAGVDEAIVNEYATRRSGGVSLKPDDSTISRKIFSKA